MAACFSDARDPALPGHAVGTLVMRRVAGIAPGREDPPDHDLPRQGGDRPASPTRHRRDLDADIHKWRRLIENLPRKLKKFKRIAMRRDRTDRSFAAMIHLAAAAIHSR